MRLPPHLAVSRKHAAQSLRCVAFLWLTSPGCSFTAPRRRSSCPGAHPGQVRTSAFARQSPHDYLTQLLCHRWHGRGSWPSETSRARCFSRWCFHGLPSAEPVSRISRGYQVGSRRHNETTGRLRRPIFSGLVAPFGHVPRWTATNPASRLRLFVNLDLPPAALFDAVGLASRGSSALRVGESPKQQARCESQESRADAGALHGVAFTRFR